MFGLTKCLDWSFLPGKILFIPSFSKLPISFLERCRQLALVFFSVLHLRQDFLPHDEDHPYAGCSMKIYLAKSLPSPTLLFLPSEREPLFTFNPRNATSYDPMFKAFWCNCKNLHRFAWFFIGSYEKRDTFLDWGWRLTNGNSFRKWQRWRQGEKSGPRDQGCDSAETPLEKTKASSTRARLSESKVLQYDFSFDPCFKNKT